MSNRGITRIENRTFLRFDGRLARSGGQRHEFGRYFAPRSAPTGDATGEVSERLKELVSKTSSGFILLVGSNPTLSALKKPVVA